MSHSSKVRMEVLVDFLDDALLADHVLGPRDIEGMMSTLAAAGVKRVAWAYYGDGHGGLRMPQDLKDGRADYGLCRRTYQELGNPLQWAVEAGHRHGLEVYAYFKPYETGVSMVIPEGSPEATQGLLRHQGGRLGVLDPFVLAHPDLRLQRRSGTVVAKGPICALRLTKRDAGPTRVTGPHLQIWTSENNYRYTPLSTSLDVVESVVPSANEVVDQAGTVVTRKGDPVRTITMSGFRIESHYVLVTTDFADGPADFTNSGTGMLAALDAQGCEIPGVFATGAGCWLAGRVNFREWGLIFDYGWGRAVTTLDVSNADGRSGFIAFARGKNATLPAALCETEPLVQEFWLDGLREMIAAGVDGVDFREENHCTHTDEPEAYGFNPVVLAQCRPGGDLRREVARVRGEAYAGFLRKAHDLLSACGVRLRYHLNMDWFRSDPPACRALAYPANIHFDWRRWIEEGLLDEAVLRSFHHRKDMLADSFGGELVEACHGAGIPISFNHHIFDDNGWYLEEAVRVADDGHFAGLILYELNTFLRTDMNGNGRFTLSCVEEICRILRERIS
jgi:hypothetical protein